MLAVGRAGRVKCEWTGQLVQKVVHERKILPGLSISYMAEVPDEADGGFEEDDSERAATWLGPLASNSP